jgi:hypothetical protein
MDEELRKMASGNWTVTGCPVDHTPKCDWFQFSVRTLFVVTALFALVCAASALARGSWQQQIAAAALFLVVFGGMVWAILAIIRGAQSRDRIGDIRGEDLGLSPPNDVPPGGT